MTRYVHPLSVAASCAAVLLLAVLSLVPEDLRPHTGASGHAEHFAAYFLTALPMGLAWPSQAARLRALLGLSACAGAFELLQNLSPGRGPAVSDWAFSSAGAVCGMIVISLALVLPRDAPLRRA